MKQNTISPAPPGDWYQMSPPGFLDWKCFTGVWNTSTWRILADVIGCWAHELLMSFWNQTYACFRLRTSHFSMIGKSVKLVQHSWVCVKCECKLIRSEWSSAIMLCCLNLIIKKNALSVNVFSTKVLIGDTNFTSPTEYGTASYVVIRAKRSSRRLQCKGGTFISQLF